MAVLAATLVAALDQTVVGTVMPTVVGELGGIDRYAWVFSAYLLLVTIATPISGRLADIAGRKPMYLAALALFVAGSALAGVAADIEQLIAFRALQGIGAGGIFAVGATVIGDLFGPRMRARMQGVFSAVWTAAALIGPGMGSLIVETVSWRWTFYVNVPVGVFAALLVVFGLRETHVHRSGRLDLPGAIALSAATVALLVGLNGTWALLLLPAAALLALVFVWIERRSSDPLVDLTLLRVPAIGSGLVLTALVSILLFSVVTYVPPFVQGVQGARPLEVGLLITAMSIGWSAGSVAIGMLMLRVGVRLSIRLGTLFLLAGAAILVTMGPGAPLLLPAAAACASGIGIGSTWTAILVGVQSAVRTDARGVATSLALFTQSLGASVGVGGLGAVLAAELGANAGPVSDLLARRARADLDPARARALAGILEAALHQVYLVLIVVAVLVVVLAWWLTGAMPDRPAHASALDG